MNQNLNTLQPQNGFTPGGPPPSGAAGSPGVDGISLAEFLQILRRRRAVILQSFVLVTVVAIVLTLMTKPVYQASARLLVENSSISYNAIDTSESRDFPLISSPIFIGDYAWVCARATVQMGVTVGEGAVLALGSIATKDLEPWFVYAGVPARKIKERRRL